jgi:hypothetical protein
MNNKQWEEEFYQKFGHIQIIKDDKNGNSYDRITDFISALLKEREAEIRKEAIEAVLPMEVFQYDPSDKIENGTQQGYNTCRRVMIRNAKEKFNINL